jgi:hypothetical protein
MNIILNWLLATRNKRHARSRRRVSSAPNLDALDHRLMLAANIAGICEGTLTQPSGGIQPSYDFVMDLVQTQNQVQGVSRIELSDPGSFGVMTLTGSMSGSTFTF